MRTLLRSVVPRSPLLRLSIGAVVVLGGALAAGWTWYVLHGQRQGRAADTLQGLQVFDTLPEFSLIDRSGRTVTRADLVGRVWVANFIYTHCTDTCPLQSARMAALQRDFPDARDLRFLSISVDPTRDTPAVLAKYAARYDADPERWWFLTGDKTAIYALIREGFRLSVEDPTGAAAPAAPTRGGVDGPGRTLARWLSPATAFAHSDSSFLAPPFLHSSWFVLGDRQARIRGYYRTEDERPMRELRRDIRALLAER